MGEDLRVLIVDDHPLFQDALEAAMVHACRASKDSVISVNCTKSHNLSSALTAIKQETFDLIFLDLHLSDTENFEGLAKLQLQETHCPIVIVSATEKSQTIATAKSLGVAGYFPKSMSLDKMSEAITLVLSGGTSFPDLDAITSQDDNAIIARLNSLTPAQRRVLSGLSNGLLNKQIAYEMGISIATVKAHMTAVFRKLGANNRTQALLIYKSATSVDH